VGGLSSRPQGDSSPAWLWDALHPAVLIENRNKRKRSTFPITLSSGYWGIPAHPAQRRRLPGREKRRVTERLSERRIARGQASTAEGHQLGYAGIRSIQLNVEM